MLRLNSRVRQLLTELLLEIDARTGFTREFTHVSEAGARAQDQHVSLCALLMAEACNIGLGPLIKHNLPALTRHRLSWVKQNYSVQKRWSAPMHGWLIFSPRWSLPVAGVVAGWLQPSACALSRR